MYYKLGKPVFEIGAALFYYKLGQTFLQIGAASLLKIRTSAVTNWGSYYKLGQPLLQNRAAFTNWDKMYYKLRQVLQIRAIFTTWGITSGDQIFVMYKAYSRKIFEQVVTVAYLTKQLQEVFCRKRFS